MRLTHKSTMTEHPIKHTEKTKGETDARPNAGAYTREQL